jgi:hypothetical protein
MMRMKKTYIHTLHTYIYIYVRAKKGVYIQYNSDSPVSHFRFPEVGHISFVHNCSVLFVLFSHFRCSGLHDDPSSSVYTGNHHDSETQRNPWNWMLKVFWWFQPYQTLWLRHGFAEVWSFSSNHRHHRGFPASVARARTSLASRGAKPGPHSSVA